MGTCFSNFFFLYLDEKITSAGYKREQKKKHSKTAKQADNYSPHGIRHENERKAYLWIISAGSCMAQNRWLVPADPSNK